MVLGCSFRVIRQVALLRAESQLPNLSVQSDLWRQAASRSALPHISSVYLYRAQPLEAGSVT